MWIRHAVPMFDQNVPRYVQYLAMYIRQSDKWCQVIHHLKHGNDGIDQPHRVRHAPHTDLDLLMISPEA